MSGATLFGGEASARATQCVVDLAAIRHNLREIAGRLPAGARVLGVVKAEAYGHGSVAVGRTLLAAGAAGLCVATADEALRLRRHGIVADLLVLSPVSPAELEPLAAAAVCVTVATIAQVEAAAAAGRRAGRDLAVHLKVDTGMGRVGCRPEEAPALLDRLALLGGARPAGLFTHLSSADSDEAVTRRELDRFSPVVRACRARFPALQVHALNSAGAMRCPEAAYDAVRLGMGLYGYSPLPDGVPPALPLRPALEWRTAVSQVKRVPAGTPISYQGAHVTAGEAVIATLPVGYADGLRRGAAGQRVILAGRLAPMVGWVTMDQVMVELPPDAVVTEGDEAVLIGRRGDLSVSAADVARHLGTSPYEVLAGIGARVPRRYRDAAAGQGAADRP